MPKLSADVSGDRLPDVIRRMQHRIDSEAGPESPELWMATSILMGLRYSRNFASELLKEVRAMRESVTYQAILEEGEAKGRAVGRVEGERRMLLSLGAFRLGPVPPAVEAQVDAIDSPERLIELGGRLFAVKNWEELLSH